MKSSPKIRRQIEESPYDYGRHHEDDTVTEPDQIFDRDGNPIDGIGPFDPNVGGDDDPEQEVPGAPEGTIVVTAPPTDPYAVAVQLVNDLMRHHDGTLTAVFWRGDYQTWTGSRWEEQSVDKLKSALYRCLAYAFYPVGPVLLPWLPNRRKIGDLLEALRAVLLLDEGTDPAQWIHGRNRGEVVSVGNGLLRIDSRTLIEHSPRYFNLTALPYDFDPAAPAPTRWLQFLDELWPGDEESPALLQEWFGYVLSGATNMHKIALLIGPKRGGKTTISKILTALIGRDAVANPTLANLNQNFGLQPLIGKSLAVVGDVRLGHDTHRISERLLSISGEDQLTADRKYKAAWTGRFGVRFMLLSNLGDASGALASRFVVLRLTQSWLGREDHDLESKLLDELGGILNWALDGLDRLHRQRRRIPNRAIQIQQTPAHPHQLDTGLRPRPRNTQFRIRLSQIRPITGQHIKKRLRMRRQIPIRPRTMPQSNRVALLERRPRVIPSRTTMTRTLRLSHDYLRAAQINAAVWDVSEHAFDWVSQRGFNLAALPRSCVS